ncbi:MAG: hypothetical protein ABI408_13690 [Gemmatimonadaceae bacterium]
MRLLTLCLLGIPLLACTKELGKPPASEPLLAGPVVANPGIPLPDTAVANPPTPRADYGAAEWVLSQPDSNVAQSVPVSTSRPGMEWSDSLDAVEHSSIAASGGKVSRTRQLGLRIHLLDGRMVAFKADSTMRMIYRYAGHIKEIHSYVVHRVPYEDTGNYLIVDDSTGDTTTVWATPVPSPDGKRFVLTSLDEDADSNVGNISVWRMVGRKPQKEFSLDDEDWASSDAVWRDSVTIDFTKNTSQDANHPFTYIKTRGRLTRTGRVLPGNPAATDTTLLTPLSDSITQIGSGRIGRTYRVFDYLKNGVEYASIVREIGTKPNGQPLMGIVSTVVLPHMDSTDHLRFSGVCGRAYNSDDYVLAVVGIGGDSVWRNATKGWRFDPDFGTLREIPTKDLVCYNQTPPN